MKESLSSLRTRAEVYMDNESMVFVIEKYKDRERFYNGFIVKVHDDMIVIFDSKIEKEIPLPIDFISMLEISERENENIWREAFRKWKVENRRKENGR